MNSVVLMGRLVRDPEMKTTNDGLNVTRFTVATDHPFKKDNPSFISCVAFKDTAERIAKYFEKGKPISLTGYIQTGSYEKNDGTKVYTTDVIVDRFEFVSGDSNGGGEKKPAKKDDGYEQVRDDDLPF